LATQHIHPDIIAMKITLSEPEIKEAIFLYLDTKGFIHDAQDIKKLTLRRRSTQTEDVGSIIITI